MAVLTLSWFIISISGRLGNIVFYMRRGTQCCRVYIKPPNPDTLAQKENRGKFAMAVMSWQQLTDEEKNKFAKRAKHLNMSGYNLYISEFMKAAKSLDTKPEPGLVQDCMLSHSLQQRFRSVSYSSLYLTWSLPINTDNQFMRGRAGFHNRKAPPEN